MLNIRKIFLSLCLSFLATGAMGQELVNPPPAPPKKPSATVHINETQYALILGGSSGTGVLTFQNKDYPFKLSGMTLGANVGIVKTSATGEVFDLVDISKFPGTYSRIESGITLGLGVAGTVLKNENGVLMNLTSTVEGIQINLSGGGVKVEFER